LKRKEKSLGLCPVGFPNLAIGAFWFGFKVEILIMAYFVLLVQSYKFVNKVFEVQQKKHGVCRVCSYTSRFFKPGNFLSQLLIRMVGKPFAVEPRSGVSLAGLLLLGGGSRALFSYYKFFFQANRKQESRKLPNFN